MNDRKMNLKREYSHKHKSHHRHHHRSSSSSSRSSRSRSRSRSSHKSKHKSKIEEKKYNEEIKSERDYWAMKKLLAFEGDTENNDISKYIEKYKPIYEPDAVVVEKENNE